LPESGDRHHGILCDQRFQERFNLAIYDRIITVYVQLFVMCKYTMHITIRRMLPRGVCSAITASSCQFIEISYSHREESGPSFAGQIYVSISRDRDSWSSAIPEDGTRPVARVYFTFDPENPQDLARPEQPQLASEVQARNSIFSGRREAGTGERNSSMKAPHG
jgi:hypothetical protein